MAKKLTKSQKKFRTAAKAANATCHRETNSVSAYKTCMSTNMKANLKKQGFKIGKRRKGRKAPAGGCKYGKLKNPVGRRICKKKPSR